MNQDPVFLQASTLLLDYLRQELVPTVLSAPDLLQLGYPGQEEQFHLGLYLYDVEEVRPNGPPGLHRLSDDTRRLPDLALAMHFISFANRDVAFHGMSMGDELLVTEAVLRAIHGATDLTLHGHKLKLELHPLNVSEKISLWQSFNTPLQPAVYFTLQPILLPSSRILQVPAVREVDVRSHSQRKRRLIHP